MKPATDTGNPTPSATRAVPRGTASACNMAPTDHTATAMMKARRVPMASMKRPANSIEMA